jgi:murein L,D-transpeptidase YcbB/YkuD
MEVTMRKSERSLRALGGALGMALLAGTVLGAPPALAQTRDANQPRNLFEAIFPDLIRQRVEREQALQPAVEPVKVEKISAPQYYNYRAVAMKRIELEAIAQAARKLASAPEVPAAPVETATVQQVSAQGEALQGGVATDSLQVASTEIAAPATVAQAVDPAEEAWKRVAARMDEVSVLAEPEIAAAVSQHYAANPGLLWLGADGKPNIRAQAVSIVFANAEKVGLEPADYAVAAPAADAADADLSAARYEVEMTARAIRYGLDASTGRVDPNKLSGYHDFPKGRGNAKAVAERLFSGQTAAELRAMNPDSKYFRALREELAALDEQEDDAIVIPADTLVKPGETSAQLPNILAAIRKKGSDALRQQFAAELAEPAAGEPARETMTPELTELVKAFQKEMGLGADGVVGRNTVSKLTDVDVETKRRRVIIAMEQLRWHPRDLGSRHVFINQPAFVARYVNGGRTQLAMRVVVGTRANQTSFFHDVIETVEYNPYWGIPESILVNEYLPKLRANPAYFDERGYEVADSKGRRMSSASINWNQVGRGSGLSVRQSPGEANALGELKILFPNKHAIYMHDTPARNLFNNSVRAYSHGCVRLHKPREMAAAVLGKNTDYIAQRLGQGHGADDVPGNIPVYVAYFTAWPDDDGKVGYFADIYGRDDRVEKAFDATRSARNPAS